MPISIDKENIMDSQLSPAGIGLLARYVVRLRAAAIRLVRERSARIDAQPVALRHRMGAWELHASYAAQRALHKLRSSILSENG